jgi:hypothetical protein
VGAWAQASSTTAQHAHVHGIAKLGIAVQGGTVSITFESPLDSLIGFEHRPTTPAQQNAVDALQARMRAAKGLIGFDAAAGCELARAEAESALFQPAAAGAGADAHADLDAAFEFRCSHPERLSRVDIGLFAAYPRLQHLDVEVVTANGQFKRDLKRPATTVELKR